MNQLVEIASYHYNWFALPGVFIGSATWLLGFASLRRERGSPISIAFCVTNLLLGIWLVGLGAAYASDAESVAWTWTRVSFVGTLGLPACVLFQCTYTGGRGRTTRVMGPLGFAIVSGLAVVTFQTDWLLAGIHRYYWGYYPIYGWFGPFLVAYYVLYLGIASHLYRVSYQKTRSSAQRKRMRFRRISMLLAAPALVDFLPAFHLGVYPFGFVFVGMYVLLTAYVIWRYRLIDVTAALAAPQVIATMADGMIVVDRDGLVCLANVAAESLWRTNGSAVGMTCAEVDELWDLDVVVRLQNPERERRAEVTYVAPDGSQHAAIVSSSKLRDNLDEWAGTVYIIHDITERWRSEERFRALVQNASDLITVIDPETEILYQSPSISHVLGYDPESVVGLKLADIVHRDDRTKFLASLGDLVMKPAGTVSGEGRVRDSAGIWQHLEFTGSDQRANPAIGGLVLNVRNVTERKQLEDELRHQALHDSLTQLANRARFGDRLKHALVRHRAAGAGVAVLFMDLDNFKSINDSLGHAAGDLLLQEVADRVMLSTQESDTAARLGGDEFAILLEDISSVADATAAAGRLLQALHEPFNLNGRDVLVRASVGIACAESFVGMNSEELLRQADIAMYVAKSHGKGCFRVFEPAMDASMIQRLKILADLPRAIERREFVLRYQPIFVLQSGGIFGVEALLRWQHPDKGLLRPDEFIPLVEESGLILEVGDWVLEEACRQAAGWRALNPELGHWAISVNVSVKQLQDPGFAGRIALALRRSGLSPRSLLLEITESAVMEDVNLMQQRLCELKELGICLAVDDFGTGYSSLSYLRQFPFDVLKIDKSFIDDLGTTEETDLTRAIVALGRSLQLEVIAEGIERHEQLSQLQVMGCALGQGFLLGRPLDDEAMGRLLTSPASGLWAA